MKETAHKRFQYPRPIHLGIAGGLGDPSGIRAALELGADYVLLGSVHQSTVEAGTSELVKEMLSTASIVDCGMGIAPDMFEIGAKVQVLTKGTMYAQRSMKLQQLYKQYASIDAIPEVDKNRLEKTIFRQSIDMVWQQTQQYWHHSPKQGDADRMRDFQIWCGPSIGAFNRWAQQNGFENWQNRKIVQVVNTLWSQVKP